MTTILFYDEGVQGDARFGGGQLKALSAMERLADEFEPILLTSTESELAVEARRRGIHVEVRDVARAIDRTNRAGLVASPLSAARMGAGVLPAARRLRAAVQELDPDVVHPNENLARLLVTVGLRGTGVPTVSWIDGVWNRSPVDPIMRALFVRSFDRLVAVSEAAAAPFGTGPNRPENVVTIYPGIELERFEEPGPPAEPFPETGGRTVIAVVGSLKPVKGHEYLLEALESLDRPDLLCLVVGAGRERSNLEDRARELGIADRTTFLGYRDDVAAIYERSDLAALPSLSEAFGRSALEAMASGVPVVASDVGGPAEIIADGETGLTVPSGDSEPLTDAIARLVDDPELRTRMGRRAREVVVEEFSFEAGVRELETQYRSVLA